MEARTQQTHLTIALVAGGDPIRGSIATGDSTASEFCGWLELLGALQRIHFSDQAEGPARAPDDIR
jgi:hypothetical protein